MLAVLEEVGVRLLTGDETLIRIPDICEATGVNYGSVYHHFGSREGVIDAAFNMLFSKLALEDIRLLQQVSEVSKSFDEYVANLSGMLGTFSFGADRVRRRSIRVRIVAAALTRPELKELIGTTEETLTQQLMQIVQNGQDRGWVRRDVSTRAIAIALQARLVGRVLDDVSPTQIEPAEWQPLMAVFLAGLLIQQ